MGIRITVHPEKCLTRENDRSYSVCTQTMSFRLTMFRVLRTCKVNSSSGITEVMNKLTLFMFTSADEVHFITKPHLIGNNILHSYTNPRGYFRTFWVESVAGTLEPLAYTRASSSEFCYPILDPVPHS